MDQIEKQRQDYQQHLEATWKRSLVEAFGPEPPLSRTWIDPYDCEDILRHFMDGNYSFLPPNGHLPLYGVEVHEDGQRLLFNLSEGSVLEALPRALRFEYIEDAPLESFLLLELREMQPSGLYENVSITEQVARIHGEDYDYGIMEQGVWHYDEDGTEVPVPEDSKVVLRLLSGKLLIVSQGSMWNRTNETWDGRHNAMTSDDIRAMIERSL